jgi:hypothetical protein
VAKKRKKRYERDHRGFIEFGRFTSTWHGSVRVKESSVACHGPCAWIFADLSYSNDPGKNPPHFHLRLKDVKNLRNRLDKFIAAAEAGDTCE